MGRATQMDQFGTRGRGSGELRPLDGHGRIGQRDQPGIDSALPIS